MSYRVQKFLGGFNVNFSVGGSLYYENSGNLEPESVKLV